jgi:hypothetical protein
MLNIKGKVATALAVGALLTSAFVPAAFASYNNNDYMHYYSDGEDNDSSSSTTENTLTQSNISDFRNNILMAGNTGGNSVEGNSGNTSEVRTGDVMNQLRIHNMSGLNVANVSPSEEYSNGSDSYNWGDNTTISTATQESFNMATNNVAAIGNTGGNQLTSNNNSSDHMDHWNNWNWDNNNWEDSYNSEGGSSTVTTGSVGNMVDIHNMGGANLFSGNSDSSSNMSDWTNWMSGM